MRHYLLPALQALQARVGWISEGGLGYLCDRLNVPPADAWGVATFYALLATSPRPTRVVHVCDDIACKCRGADQLIAELERSAPSSSGTTDHASRTTEHGPRTSEWRRSPCLGMCDQSPAAYVTIAGERPQEFQFGHVTADQVRRVLAGSEDPAHDEVPSDVGRHLRPGIRQPLPELRLLHRVGRVDPASLDAYRAVARIRGAREGAARSAPEAVIAEITASKLMGRGGAAFPTGRKWDAVRTQPVRPHYLVCNADESEPGTFKDRVLMDGRSLRDRRGDDDRRVCDGLRKGLHLHSRRVSAGGMRVCRHAIDARASRTAWQEYSARISRSTSRSAAARGAYICGEETAIFESIEGKRGEPRNKPPFPVQVGLFGKPTVVNNVETLANVPPHRARRGRRRSRAIGTAQSTGTRLFCLSAARAGIRASTKSPFGTTLRDADRPRRRLCAGTLAAAVLLGGAAGTFVRPTNSICSLTHEDTRAARDDARIRRRHGRSTTPSDLHDSCCGSPRSSATNRAGSACPCRVGTVRQEEALHRIASQRTSGGVQRPSSRCSTRSAQAMKDGSICGLGQTAYSAVESAIKRLRLYDEAAESRDRRHVPASRLSASASVARRAGTSGQPREAEDRRAHDRSAAQRAACRGHDDPGACASDRHRRFRRSVISRRCAR